MHITMSAKQLAEEEANQDPLAILDELSEDEMQALEDAAVAASEEKTRRREELAKVIQNHRNDAVTFRNASGIETQWAEDQAYYEGHDESNQSQFYKGPSPGSPLIAKPKAKYRSRVFLNITRPYCETASAKVIEVLSPTDMRQWSIEPKPIPNMPERPSPLVQALQQAPAPAAPGPDGQPVAPAQPQVDPVEEMMKAAKRCAAGAQLWIDDKLTGCDFSGQIRVVVDTAARLGTGVMRGPVPESKRSMKVDIDPGTGEERVVLLDAINPASRAVDLWNCYPDPACGDNIHNGQFFIEHDELVEKQVLDLRNNPGYIKEALDQVIEQGPKFSSTDTMAMAPHSSKDLKAARYHVWYYYGFLTREDVMSMDCTCEEGDEIENVGVPVVITMINDTPVKAHLNTMSDGRFPYDLMCWQRVAGSPFGIGIARQIRACQAILNSHVRAMMENAGLSTGPQIIISRGSVLPADGSWEITPRKVWLMKPDADIQDAQKAMQAFSIPSHQAELLAAIDFALKMAENVTGLPVLLQGQQGPNGVPETLGGMQILVANASSLLRRMARVFDDYLIKPHITAYYTFMMIYAEDSSIKGDFNIVAHGSTELIARDQRNQFLMQTVPQLMANPQFGIDPTRLFKELGYIAGMRNPEAVQFTPEEMAVMQKAQQEAMMADPRLQVAAINAKTRMDVAAMTNETNQARIEKDRDRDTIYVNAETLRTKTSSDIKVAELELRRELALLEYANRNQITLDKLKAQLAIEGGRNNLAREIASMPTTKEIAEAISPKTDSEPSLGEVGAGIATQLQPGGEPPGRAPLGMGEVL